MKTVDETVDAIREIAEQIGFTGQNWKRLLDALNEAGVTSRRGQSWNTIQAVQQWCARNKVFAGTTPSEPSAALEEPARPEAEQLELVADVMQEAVEVVEREISQGISEQTARPEPVENLPLTPGEMTALREIIAAWRDRGTVLISTPEQPTYRPSFPGPRDNTGIRVNRRLLRAALEKAKTEDATLTGGGKLSPLIEHLLWGYLGYDPKFLKP